MRKTLLVLAAISTISLSAQAADKVAPAPNGIKFPADYQTWQVISVAHRVDNNTMRVILGNKKAIKAVQAGKTNPWPDGAVIGKIVWKQTNNAHWDKAVVPDQFVHAEFMFKNAKKYASTGGWGWARWKGLDQQPYGKDANFTQECVACHTPVKNNDWVFTIPASLPKTGK
ncbi:MAG: cytochrome P460 family protein [Gammaproteobacteria bacterium]|nr:cytochrome P460 family protein [Gammaproteobacteria bacterium]MDH5650594.1 cytochrome P460 family protein [Gammaproteobacteria bacterium]